MGMRSNNFDIITQSTLAETWSNARQKFGDVCEVINTLKPVEPLYLFCARGLARRAQYFQCGFPGNVSYAVKANPKKRVLKTLVNQGISEFDVASITEIKTVRAIAPNATLHFNNPIKAAHSIASAYHDYGVRSFALDDLAELDKIMQATGNARDLTLSVRFKLAHQLASFDFGSKFGASFDKAVVLLQAINSLDIKPALTFHPGSQCISPEIYFDHIKTAANIVSTAAVEVKQINVGGGFPEQYQHGDVPTLHTYFLAIRKGLATYFPNQTPKLICEPGRSMVASSTSLLTQVIHMRDDQSAIYLNDGVYGGLQEQSIVDLPLPMRFWRKDRQLCSTKKHTTIFGPSCDPTDRLPKLVAVPVDLRAGDYIEFGLAGAYGSATATQFNGFSSDQYVDVDRCFYAL